MSKLVAVTTLLAALLATVGIVQAHERFVARLTGKQEVPPVETETTGRAVVEVHENETEAEFELIVFEGRRVTQAHIHCGAAGKNGPIVLFLAGLVEQGLDVDGLWVSSAAFTSENIIEPSCGETIKALAGAMRDGKTHVIVHTVENPGGEIRGQLEREPEPNRQR